MRYLLTAVALSAAMLSLTNSLAAAPESESDAAYSAALLFNCLDARKLDTIGYTGSRVPKDGIPGLESIAHAGYVVRDGTTRYHMTLDTEQRDLVLIERIELAGVYHDAEVVTYALGHTLLGSYLESRAPHRNLAALRSTLGFRLGSSIKAVAARLRNVGAGCQGGYFGGRGTKYLSEMIIYHGDVKVDAIFITVDL